MSTNVNINGTTYPVPTSGDTDWAASLNTFLTALAAQVAGVFQWCVSTFPSAASYFAPPGYGVATATEITMRVPKNGVLRNLLVVCTTAPTVAGCVITVRRNGSNTTLTCTVAASGTTAADLTHSVAVAQGDTISVSVNATGDTVTPVNLAITLSLCAS